MVVLDSGAVTGLAKRNRWAAALIAALRSEGLWPPEVPSAVLVECLIGNPGIDAPTNRLLKLTEINEDLPQSVARRAARMRTLAGQGSAIDAIVIATAEPGGTVLTTDVRDLGALATHADRVFVEKI